ncbi:MAG: hypothetical protein IKA33_05170 [Candidatus Methanomethylophilaceae archaeon]|nr:hypothetical protein [Candidatus Methanomethylophilaceae archaeon]
MRPMRMLGGISLFAASGWLSPMASDLLGMSQIVGFITVGGLIAFIAGAMFWSGVKE